MADFRQRLKVAIESVFDASGFRALRATARRTNRQVEKFKSNLQFARSDRGFKGESGQFVSPENLDRTRVMRTRLSRLALAFGLTEDRMGRARSGLKGVGSRMGSVNVNARQLQMQLLGLQFQMLAIAFIFGAVIASALSAVGAFSVLGNALKFLMLPTALDLLGPILDISNAIFGMDESTRRTIGTIFGMIAAGAALVSIFAVLLNGIITIAGAISSFGGFLLNLFGITNGLAGLMLRLRSVILRLTGTVVSGIGAALGFLAGFAAGFMIVIKVAKKFGKIVALAVGAVLVVLGAIVAFFVSIPAVVAAAIGLIIGAIVGLIVVFREELWAAIMFVFNGIISIIQGIIGLFMGLINFIVNDVVGGFVKMGEMIYNFLFGNSIFPDLINGIIGLFFKLPKMALKAAKGIVDSIVSGVKSAGSAIWNAFKKVLPDFLVDALEKGGQAVKGIVKAGGDIVGKAGDVIGDVGSGIADAAGKAAGSVVNTAQNLNPFGGKKTSGNNQGGATVNNNDVTVNANMTQTESTPQEEEERMSQIVAQGTNNETGDRTGGF